MGKSDAEFRIGADSTDAVAAFMRVADSGKHAAEQLNGEFKKISGAIDKVNGLFEKMAGALAMGFATKMVIDAARDIGSYSDGIDKATQKTGIAAEKFQGLAFAAKMSDVASQDFDKSLRTLAKATEDAGAGLQEPAMAFRAMGIEASTLKNLKTDELLAIIADKFAASADGSGKAAVAMRLFGESGMTMIPFLNKGSASLGELTAQANQLGLVLDGETIAAGSRLDDQFKVVDSQMESIRQRMQVALIPAFLQMTEAFSEATQKGGAMDGVFQGLADVLIIVGKSVSYVAEGFTIAGKQIGATGAAIAAAASGDFAAAKRIMSDLHNDVLGVIASHEALRSALEKPVNVPASVSPSGDRNKPELHLEKTTAATSKVAQYDAELTELKAAHERESAANNTFLEFGKQRELIYWQDILKAHNLSTQERTAVERKVLDATIAIRKEQAAIELDAIRSGIDAEKAGSVERIQAAGEAAVLIGQKFGIESKEYRKVLDDMTKAAQEHNAQLDALAQQAVDVEREHNLVLLDMERERLGLSRTLGDLNAVEELQALRNLKEQQFQIELSAEQDKAQLLEGDAVAYQAALNRLALMKQKHELDMQKAGNQITGAKKQDFDQLFAPMTSAFDKSVNGIIQGTVKVHDAMRNMAQSIVLEFASMGVKMVTNWVRDELSKTQATATGAAVRGGIEKTAATESVAVSAWATIKKIMNSAWDAMAAVYASIAQIPYVGPFLAPVMAAGAFAVVAGAVGNVASASGGYDIPSGINPMTQLHQNEMVLPAHLADPMRDMLAGGGSGGNVTVHIHATDAQSVKRLLLNNKAAVADALRAAVRDGKLA